MKLRDLGRMALEKKALETYAAEAGDKVQTDVLSNARQACYQARDAFYACLEKKSNNTATEIASVGLLYPVDCKKTRVEFEKKCRPAWVKHFDRQYCAKKRVQRFLDDNDSRRGPLLPSPNPPARPAVS